eukprot:CAMPEP_0197039584 /NCGR_PEP_ID=MMETSP1384-20130603/16355_1 /TAXON_ID=29189 /ORGANISM="Ammonia sp." /LENGTH=165 /DNA_ID=CAMNT_0042470201 /DNA_START=201 /DNA_END=695 /DNA_ORIENTATION=-
MKSMKALSVIAVAAARLANADEAQYDLAEESRRYEANRGKFDPTDFLRTMGFDVDNDPSYVERMRAAGFGVGGPVRNALQSRPTEGVSMSAADLKQAIGKKGPPCTPAPGAKSLGKDESCPKGAQMCLFMFGGEIVTVSSGVQDKEIYGQCNLEGGKWTFKDYLY